MISSLYAYTAPLCILETKNLIEPNCLFLLYVCGHVAATCYDATGAGAASIQSRKKQSFLRRLSLSDTLRRKLGTTYKNSPTGLRIRTCKQTDCLASRPHRIMPARATDRSYCCLQKMLAAFPLWENNKILICVILGFLSYLNEYYPEHEKIYIVGICSKRWRASWRCWDKMSKNRGVTAATLIVGFPINFPSTVCQRFHPWKFWKLFFARKK